MDSESRNQAKEVREMPKSELEQAEKKQMTKLSNRKLLVLQDGAEGFCIRGAWSWKVGFEPVTREVNSLRKSGLVSCTYYRGGKAGAWPTEAGQKLLEEITNDKA